MMRRSAFSLLESLAVIIVLAIAIPPAMSMMTEGARSQADAVAQTRATWFATAILETILADVASEDPDLGFEALDNFGVYLKTPVTGLHDRLAPVRDHYEPMGFSYDASAGPLSNETGVVTGDAQQDVFRTVTVEVSWSTLRGQSRTLTVDCVVTEL